MMLKHSRLAKTLSTLSFLLLSPLLITPAHSSTTEAWSAGDKAMARACRSISTLKDVKVIKPVTHFDNSVGYSVLLQEGTYPQKHMNGQKGQELCLYKRDTHKATVTEAQWK